MNSRKAITIVKKVLSYLYKGQGIKWKGTTLTQGQGSFLVDVWDKQDSISEPITARVYQHEEGFYQVVILSAGDYINVKHPLYQVGNDKTYPSVYAGYKNNECNVRIFSH